MSNAEGTRNLANVSLHAALVLHDRCAADHLQVSDFCQIIKDFVLHTISEERVFGIGAQILEGEHRDALMRNRPGRIRDSFLRAAKQPKCNSERCYQEQCCDSSRFKPKGGSSLPQLGW